MAAYTMIPARRRRGADFAVRLEDDALCPYVKAGNTVYLQRSADLDDGDVGLFYSRGGMVFRQFCQDSQGNIYLFSPDRSRKEADLVIPADALRPVCYGKVLLGDPVPLPED